MRGDIELNTRRSTMILHVEHEQWGGPYRITTEQPDTESDLSAMLWQGGAPESTTLTLAEEQLGYRKYDLTGVHDAESQQLRPDAYEWLSTARPETPSPWHLDALLLSVALERMTVERLMLALVVAAAVTPR
jgi:hypothetical protein